MRKILVTGGAGYVGSHTCKALAQAGYEPVVFDNLSRGHRWAVRWGPLEEGDILDEPRLVQVIERHRPEAVVHFAAFAYVGESNEDPLRYYRNNVGGSMSVLSAMRANAVSKIVFSSSCATYGVPRTIPIADDHPQDPINPYGRTKLMVEHILHDSSNAYGLDSCALRYFNAAGADPDGEIGEQHEPEPHLIPNVLRAASGEAEDFTVHGDDYETRDGTCIRDYIHVTDLARAHVLALTHIASVRGFRHYNLGTESGHSVNEILDVARKVTGKSITARIGKRRPGDPPTLVANSERARADLGWRPQHAEIQEIIETAWNWEIKKKEIAEGR